jgi:hypothetical protein
LDKLEKSSSTKNGLDLEKVMGGDSYQFFGTSLSARATNWFKSITLSSYFIPLV